MDKFGIFKMLSSLFDFYKSQNENSKPISTDNSTSSPLDMIKGLSSLFSNKTPLGENSTQKNNFYSHNVANKTPPQKKDFLPLQQGMISVMKNHDDFVKRVKYKSPVK